MLNNELTRTASMPNDFTMALRKLCEASGDVLVRMRNNGLVKVCFKPSDEKNGNEDSFATADWSRWWYMNGASCTSTDFDLIEFEDQASDRQSNLRSSNAVLAWGNDPLPLGPLEGSQYWFREKGRPDSAFVATHYFFDEHHVWSRGDRGGQIDGSMEWAGPVPVPAEKAQG